MYWASSSLRAWTLRLPSVVLSTRLQVVEAERVIGGKGADDAEPDALVYQAVEFGKLVSLRQDALTVASCRRAAGVRLWRACDGMRGGLATVPPRDEKSEDDVQAPKARAPETNFPRLPGLRTARPPSSMKHIPMTGTMGTENEPPVMMPAP